MLTPKFVRENLYAIERMLQKRHMDVSLEAFKDLETERLDLIKESEDKKALRNQLSKQVAHLKAKSKSPSTSQLRDMRTLSESIKLLDEKRRQVEVKVHQLCLELPNQLSPDVPEGRDSSANVEIKRWKEPSNPTPCLSHVELSEYLDLADFKRAAKVSGSNFVFMKKVGAALERALISFFLEEALKRDYVEYYSPFIAHRDSLMGTGQLPRFEEDIFKLKTKQPLYLIPTAEVSLTNLYRDELIDKESLPLKIVGYSPCFRQEAGAAGKDTQGLIRLHQFNKVELVKITTPESSEAEHLSLMEDAQSLLQLLDLPYRVVLLCGGDMGLAAAKCYDLEVWMPSMKKYVEISSCSNFWSYQANRLRIRYKDDDGHNVMLHTINGSALAVGRTLAALLENHQLSNKTVRIPKVLQPYLHQEVITPPLRV